jgi:hypothetical protein
MNPMTIDTTRGDPGTGAGWLVPVWAWLRLDLRRRARSLVALALLVTLAAATVMAAAAGAGGGGSAVDRLLARTLPATVGAVPNQPGFDWTRIRRLPEVAALTEFLLTGSYVIEGIPGANVAFPSLDRELFTTVERPVVLSGRLADPSRPDEAMITPKFASQFHRSVGDTVTALLPTPAQTDAAQAAEPPAHPAGPRQPLKIVGIIRSPQAVDAPGQPGSIGATPAFTTRYWTNLTGTSNQYIVNAFVRLRHQAADIPAFRADFARVTGRQDIDFIDFAETYRVAKKDTGFEADALLAFALAAYLAAIVLVGQTIVRYTAAAAADVGALRAFGLTTPQATLAAATGPCLASAAGLLLAVVAAIAVSPLFPIGSASYLEPDPGARVDPLVLGGVAGVVAVMVLVATGATAWAGLHGRTGRDARARRSPTASAAYRSGLPVPAVVGARFALEPGRGGASRPALVGAVAGVLGVLAAFTFQAGVADAVHRPERFGQTFQVVGFLGFGGQDFGPVGPLLAKIARDPDVVAVNDTRVGAAGIGPASDTLFTYDAVSSRPLPIPMLSGRMPRAAAEIVLTPEKARELHATVGDLVTVNARGTARMRLTGTAFVPEDSHNTYTEGGWVTGAGFRLLFPDGFSKYHESHIALRPGADVSAVARRLNAMAGGDAFGPPFATPAPVTNLRNVKVLPTALGAFLALLAVGAVGHTLFVTVRRRRHELAVLRALGLTRWQSRSIVATQATTILVIGLALGVPLGLALGRTIWRSVATSAPAFYVPPTATIALALIGPAVVAIGAALSTVPARRAARLRVADVLRAE